MIYYALHTPRMYTSALGGMESAGVLSQCLSFLEDVARNGICLVDGGGTMARDMAARVSNWPEKYRKRGQELLERLEKRNRMVAVPDEQRVAETTDVCRLAEAVSRTEKYDYLVVPPSCVCGSSGALCEVPGAIPIHEYSLLYPDRFKETTLTYQSGENGRFEREVLGPVFRTAKWVRAIDRLIGSKACKKDGSFEVPPENFRRGLEWVVSRLAKHSDSSRLKELTVVTEHPRGLNAFQRQLLEKQYQDFATRLRGQRMFAVKVKLQDPLTLPHNRYLMTDQVVLDVGQGFDLVNESGRLRELSVSLVSRSEFNRLTRTQPIA